MAVARALAAAAVLAAVRALLVRSVPAPLPGTAVLPEDEPELVALVAEVRARLGVSTPVLLRATPDVEAGLVVARLRGRRVALLLLGVPLLRRLPALELAAVVAHELGHRGAAVGRGTALLLQARDRLAASASPRIGLRGRTAASLLAATRVRAWHAELAADRLAAHALGAGALRAALESTSTLAVAFSPAREATGEGSRGGPAAGGDPYSRLDAALDDPERHRLLRRRARAADRAPADALSGHPPVRDRLRACSDTAGAPGWPPGWLLEIDAHRPVPLRTLPRLTAAATLTLREDARARGGGHEA
ncbi:MAG: hypothetical protein U0Q15_04995 [Kineosporiaceae bacterium]